MSASNFHLSASNAHLAASKSNIRASDYNNNTDLVRFSGALQTYPNNHESLLPCFNKINEVYMVKFLENWKVKSQMESSSISRNEVTPDPYRNMPSNINKSVAVTPYRASDVSGVHQNRSVFGNRVEPSYNDNSNNNREQNSTVNRNTVTPNRVEDHLSPYQAVNTTYNRSRLDPYANNTPPQEESPVS